MIFSLLIRQSLNTPCINLHIFFTLCSIQYIFAAQHVKNLMIRIFLFIDFVSLMEM